MSECRYSRQLPSSQRRQAPSTPHLSFPIASIALRTYDTLRLWSASCGKTERFHWDSDCRFDSGARKFSSKVGNRSSLALISEEKFIWLSLRKKCGKKSLSRVASWRWKVWLTG